MAELLRQAQAQGISSSYAGRLLAAMPIMTKDERRRTKTERSSSVVRPSSPLIEPLNDRELQILRLLAADLSDREIAQELYLSINTVKWYNRQIYGKLGVRRRDPAVARALELGILRDA
jgi:LuxR family maltose regulon positive regulatory protein